MPDTEECMPDTKKAAERMGMFKNIVLNPGDEMPEGVEICSMSGNAGRPRKDKIRCADCMKCYDADCDVYGYLGLPRQYAR